MNNFTYSGTGLTLTEQAEGLRLHAYQDSGGVWTCGYGHTGMVGPSTVCTVELAAEWLAQDCQEAANAINRLVLVPLTQNEFDALTDFVFNEGAGAFSKSTLLDILNTGNYAEAAAQFDRWTKCNGTVLAGLLKRRQAETSEFNGGLNE